MKTWLITGCSSGLGRSIARAVLQKGYQAVVTARDVRTLVNFEKEFPETAFILPVDVTKEETVLKAVEQAAQRFDGIDVLVNNAGYGYRAAVEEGDPDKGAELIIEAVEAENTPFRLLLGSDAVKFADMVMEKRRKEYEEWRQFSRKSDFC